MPFPAPPSVPREHGAWTMLAIPMVLGLAAGGWRSPAARLVPPAAVLVYLAHQAIVPWAQRVRERKAVPPGFASRRLVWGAIYLAGAMAVFAAAVLLAGPAARGPFLALAAVSAALAAVYALASILGRGRSVVPEILGMAGMSSSGPMMAAAAGRPLAPALFGSAALALGYCLSSLSFVRAYDRIRDARSTATAACIAAHIVILGALAAADAAGALPAGWWVAFVPVVVRTAWGFASPPANLRALGMRELWVAIAFTILASAALARPA